MKKNILFLIMVLAVGMLITQNTIAQGIGINETGAAPDSSAILDVQSSEKGLLPPRMTTTQRNAISSPAKGLLIYNTDLDCLQYNIGTPTNPNWICSDGTNQSNPPATISLLDCAGATNNGTLTEGQAVSGVNSVIAYTGGNGGTHSGQTVTSTGVTGLTATLTGGNFANGAGTLTYDITGTPNSDGTASFAIDIGGETCTLEITVDPGSISTLDCAGAIINGTLVDGVPASGVSAEIAYTGGNGGPYNGQTVTSTGVTGLTATLTAGNFTNGAGTLIYDITGTPNSDGTASFAIQIGNLACILEITVNVNPYPLGTVFCNNVFTEVLDVTNPITGKTWMDRNLGASQVATSSTDANSYGDLYQWGRGADGHQCRTSPTTTSLSSADQPAHGDFILSSGNTYNFPYADWKSPQNDNLWQGVNGVNNPCPNGYRIPTDAELNSERLSWSSNGSAGAFSSPLKFTLGGEHSYFIGVIGSAGGSGFYWSSSVQVGNVSNQSYRLLISGSTATSSVGKYRAYGLSVRCIKD